MTYENLKSLTPDQLLEHLLKTVQMAQMQGRYPYVKTYMPEMPEPVLFEIGDFKICARFIEKPTTPFSYP
jgi:hypothetical protein